MPSENYIKNVAIVGATGNLGGPTLSALLSADRFHVTAIVRNESSKPLPNHPSLTVKAGDLSSTEFIKSALKGQDALVIILAWQADHELQTRLVEAAAEEGVQWIVPTEFGSDTANERFEAKLGMLVSKKRMIREKIEQLGKEKDGPKWLGLVTNPWFDFCLPLGAFLISAPSRKATIYSGNIAKFNTTTLQTSGLAIARLLSLPLKSSTGPDLASKANSHIYVSSFRVSQEEILAAVQRVTETEPSQWTISHKDIDEDIQEKEQSIANGEIGRIGTMLFGLTMRKGEGGDYESVRKLSNDELGLPAENLDEVVRDIVKGWKTDVAAFS